MRSTIINSCFFGGVSKGRKAVWEITEKCQLKCKHCCNEHRRNSREVSLENAKKIVDELKDNLVEKIIFTGGDPLMYPYIMDIIEYSKHKGMKVSISTNGIMLNKLSEKLKSVNPDKIIIGLDGFSKNSNDTFRGVDGAFQCVKSGLNKLKDSNIKIDIHCVITTLNIHEIETLSEYCNENNFELSLSSLVEITEKPLINRYVVKNNTLLNNLYKTNFKGSVKFVRHTCGTLGACYAGQKIIGIKANGSYTPCLWISNFTNKFETYNIQEVFRFRSECILDSEKCTNCLDYQCQKGCPAVALSVNGNLDPLCSELKHENLNCANISI